MNSTNIILNTVEIILCYSYVLSGYGVMSNIAIKRGSPIAYYSGTLLFEEPEHNDTYIYEVVSKPTYW